MGRGVGGCGEEMEIHISSRNLALKGGEGWGQQKETWEGLVSFVAIYLPYIEMYAYRKVTCPQWYHLIHLQREHSPIGLGTRTPMKKQNIAATLEAPLCPLPVTICKGNYCSDFCHRRGFCPFLNFVSKESYISSLVVLLLSRHITSCL